VVKLSRGVKKLLTVDFFVDKKQHFACMYQQDNDPRYDSLPHPIPPALVPEKDRVCLQGEPEIWDGVSNLPGFKEAYITYYRACLNLARSLIRTFALALDLPEDYFEDIITYPGADCSWNYYPGDTTGANLNLDPSDVGMGSHTDVTIFTLLWQDSNGGLTVLNRQGEWIKATPIPDTFVVNIADLLMRMTNDRWISTVHKVEVNQSPFARVSMPFFFGKLIPIYIYMCVCVCVCLCVCVCVM
jgi:isopenicillin N synthase-like dioxygenase